MCVMRYLCVVYARSSPYIIYAVPVAQVSVGSSLIARLVLGWLTHFRVLVQNKINADALPWDVVQIIIAEYTNSIVKGIYYNYYYLCLQWLAV